MIYKVNEVDDVMTSTGKPMKKLSLEGVAKKINIFSDFPHYAEIKEDSTIDAEIRKNDKGYDNLYSNEIKPRGNSNFKSQQIEKAVERKEQGIARSQDNKDWSIRVSSTMNKAVDLAIAEIKDITTLNTLERDILKWREWLWRNWEVSDTQYPPF